jgi:hypothetical protein
MPSQKEIDAYLAAGQDARPEAIEANASAWFKQAVKKGVINPDGSPRQGLKGAKTREMEGEGHSGWNPATGGYGAFPSDTTGMRDWARQHGMSEDYDRFDEATLNIWAKQRDQNCPPKFPYQAYDGTGCSEKPIDSGLDAPPSQRGQGIGGGRGGGGRGQPPPPPKPVTFGDQLSYTGNPMQDMLINMFNTRTAVNDPTKKNIFGMGADRQAGGEGADADKPMMAQALAGGGLWRGSKETFGGFRADQAGAAQPKKRGRGRRRRGGGAPPPPAPEEIAAPPGQPPTAPTPAAPTQPINVPDFESGIGGMMKKRYGPKMMYA